ncbi:MAG: RNA methyltransferase [Lachnospiraceae bacterium]|nr:RNA methyltransferase [Lachnospiraceae bacterium]
MNRIDVTDFSMKELDVFYGKNEAQLLHYFEPHGGIFIAESPNVVKRALDAGYEPMSLLIEERDLEGQKELLEQMGEIPVYVAKEQDMKTITGYGMTRGVLCAFHRKPLCTIKELCKNAHRIAVLEDVVNPTNVGAIIRSAAALSVDGVILTNACANPLCRRAIRVSMGCVFQIPWTIAEKDENPLKELEEEGFLCAAMALSKDSISLEDKRLKQAEKLALILGTEGEGLKEETMQQCHYKVVIPMKEEVDSLNVAAAGAVAFWELKYRG